jgi:hydroxymethylglutaryl-CoA lyase
MSDFVAINDVGPRDGLQNQPRVLTPAERLRLIETLVHAGLPAIEVGSFVSPKAVPAMAGTDEVVRGLPPGKTVFSVLIPNRKGYDIARQSGVAVVELVVASTQMMNLKNINMGTEQAMAVAEGIIAAARADGVRTLACVATAWECPFEGLVDPEVSLQLAREMFHFGADEVVFADTIGAANPASVDALISAAVSEFGAERLACHFHDTRGMGVANASAAVRHGIRKFDASIGGLGGCPFAPGATGNVATEDLAVMFSQMGLYTGINLGALIASVDLAIALTGNCEGGKSLRWLRRQQEKGALH